MEYDPAFPTGEVMKKRKKKKKIATIPLPELPQTSLEEIPMPEMSHTDMNAILPEDIPEPPPPAVPLSSSTEPIAEPAIQISSESSRPVSPPQGVKFQMKVPGRHSSSVSDSAETIKPISLSSALSVRPALKTAMSLVKRKRAGVLPTGVLGTRKKPEDSAPTSAIPPPTPKEVERFVPPTMMTVVPQSGEPAVTLTSEMLDAAKRAISQINSALLGVSTPRDSSIGNSNNGDGKRQAIVSSLPTVLKSSGRGRSPLKRRRSRSISKRKRHSSHSSSSSSSRRGSRTKRHRSRSGSRKRRRRSGSRHRDKRRRSNSEQSRSQPQKRERSRSVRRMRSRSLSASDKRTTGKGKFERRKESSKDVIDKRKEKDKEERNRKERNREKDKVPKRETELEKKPDKGDSKIKDRDQKKEMDKRKIDEEHHHERKRKEIERSKETDDRRTKEKEREKDRERGKDREREKGCERERGKERNKDREKDKKDFRATEKEEKEKKKDNLKKEDKERDHKNRQEYKGDRLTKRKPDDGHESSSRHKLDEQSKNRSTRHERDEKLLERRHSEHEHSIDISSRNDRENEEKPTGRYHNEYEHYSDKISREEREVDETFVDRCHHEHFKDRSRRMDRNVIEKQMDRYYDNYDHYAVLPSQDIEAGEKYGERHHSEHERWREKESRNRQREKVSTSDNYGQYIPKVANQHVTLEHLTELGDDSDSETDKPIANVNTTKPLITDRDVRKPNEIVPLMNVPIKFDFKQETITVENKAQEAHQSEEKKPSTVIPLMTVPIKFEIKRESINQKKKINYDSDSFKLGFHFETEGVVKKPSVLPPEMNVPIKFDIKEKTERGKSRLVGNDILDKPDEESLGNTEASQRSGQSPGTQGKEQGMVIEQTEMEPQDSKVDSHKGRMNDKGFEKEVCAETDIGQRKRLEEHSNLQRDLEKNSTFDKEDTNEISHYEKTTRKQTENDTPKMNIDTQPYHHEKHSDGKSLDRQTDIKRRTTEKNESSDHHRRSERKTSNSKEIDYESRKTEKDGTSDRHHRRMERETSDNKEIDYEKQKSVKDRTSDRYQNTETAPSKELDYERQKSERDRTSDRHQRQSEKKTVASKELDIERQKSERDETSDRHHRYSERRRSSRQKDSDGHTTMKDEASDHLQHSDRKTKSSGELSRRKRTTSSNEAPDSKRRSKDAHDLPVPHVRRSEKEKLSDKRQDRHRSSPQRDKESRGRSAERSKTHEKRRSSGSGRRSGERKHDDDEKHRSRHSERRDRSVERRKRDKSPPPPAYKSLKEEAEERARIRKEESIHRERTTNDCSRRKEQHNVMHSPSHERLKYRSERQYEGKDERIHRPHEETGGNVEPSIEVRVDDEDMEENLQQKAQSTEVMNILKKFGDFFNALSNMTGNQTHAQVAAVAAAVSTNPQDLLEQRTAAERFVKSPVEELRSDSSGRRKRGRHRRKHSRSATSSSAMSVSEGSSLPESPNINETSNVLDRSISARSDWQTAQFQAPYQTDMQNQWPQVSCSSYSQQGSHVMYQTSQYSGDMSNEEYQRYFYQQQQQQYLYGQQQQQQQQVYDASQYGQQMSSWPANQPYQAAGADLTSSQSQVGYSQLALQALPQQYQHSAQSSIEPNALNFSLQITTDQPIVKRYDEGWITSESTGLMSPNQTPLVTPTGQLLHPRSPNRPGRPETPAGNPDSDRQDSDFDEHLDGEDDFLDEDDDEFDEGSLVGDDAADSAGEGSALEVEIGEGDHPSLAPDDISSVADKELEMLQKEELSRDKWADRPRTPPLEERYPDAPKPIYEHIEMSEFRSKSVMRSRSKLETNRWVCDCTVPNPDEAAQGMRPCGQDCINRVLNIECGSRCPIAELCTNRQFQEKKYAAVEPYYAGPDKGWGLQARDRIYPGTFVIEYVGEVIDFREFKRRIISYEKEGHAHHYFMSLEADSFIDAGTKGNWARFVNHSCDPNSETQKWNVHGQVRIGFFAKRPIEKGEEITIDYQFVQYGRNEQKCYCGASNCNGVMGSTSKQLQDKVRMKDTRLVERRLAKLLSMDCLKNAEDVHMLLKVLVQEYLMRDIRFDLLGVVLQTESEDCLKMFRQYNGLELIASYMRDSDANDWTMKTRLLEVLEKIPVFEQKQLKSGTNIFAIVNQWSIDPRFCRQRSSTMPPSCGASGSSGSGRGIDSVVPSPATTTTNEDGDTADSVAGGSVSGGPDTGAVDLETGEKTGLDSDEDSKHWKRIRDAAERLHFRWQQLPDEIYRIPKVERYETEQQLQPSLSGVKGTIESEKISRHRSSVLSSSQSRGPLYSWGLPVSDKKRPASPSSRASEGSLKPGTSSSSGAPNVGTGTPRLPKDEFRRLFEAYVRFEEDQKKLSEQRKQQEIDLSKIQDPSLQDAVEKIRQLLSRTLLHAIEQLKRGMQPQLVLPPDLTEVAQDEKVQRLLGELQHVEMSQLLTLLSVCDGSLDGPSSSNERGSMLLQGQSVPVAGPEEQLPPNWKWARDRDGRLYFYHVLTKKTQWEAPLYPWDAGEDDPDAYCYNNAHLFQVNHDEIAAMHVRIQKILKEKAKKLQRKKAAKKAKKDPNLKEKQKTRFHKQMYKIIASHLHKYRSNDTKIGRITNSSDLKYLGKKLAQTILHKELKRVRVPQDLEVNGNVTSKAITYVDKYMIGRGPIYKRRSGSQRRQNSGTPVTPSEPPMRSKRQRQKDQKLRKSEMIHQEQPLHLDEKSIESLTREAVNDFIEKPHTVSFRTEKSIETQETVVEKTKSFSLDDSVEQPSADNLDGGDSKLLIAEDPVMADEEVKELDNLL